MSIKGGIFGRFLMFAMFAMLALPVVVSAQGNGKGRGKPTDVFVNGHDARDGRYDKDNQRRRNRGDVNGDGRIDWRDRDINGDGRIDWRDQAGRRDVNGDGVIDWRDQNGRDVRDVNGDGVIDWRDQRRGDVRDVNGDGVIDWRDQNTNNNDWRYRNGRNGTAGDGYGNYGGSLDLRQTALNAGFADGVNEGRKDRSRGEGFEFRDESGYQKATRDYSSRLGDRGLYMTYYRQAFENGYRDGYAGY